jgi:phenylacetate-CoA ligase
LRESAQWTSEQLHQYQLKKLFETVEFAATTVPYYQDLFKTLGLPAKLRSLDQFLALPLLNKDIVRGAGDRMLSNAVPYWDRYTAKTGGTSFRPLTFWMSREAYGIEWAFVHDLLSRYEVSPKERKIVIRGTRIMGVQEGQFYQYNPVYSEIQISPFHIKEDVMRELAPTLKVFAPSYIHGYPSAITAFARIAVQQGWEGSLRLKAVLTIAESLYPWQRQVIGEAFRCPVFSFYGQSERVIFAGSVPGQEDYLVDPRYGFTELIDGELVGTGFINKATPLLRYRTGDRATIQQTSSEARGVKAFTKIVRLEGRWLQDVLIGKSGTHLPVMVFPYDLFEGIERYQFVQHSVGKVEVRVVPSSDFRSDHHLPLLLKLMRERIGDELEIDVRTVASVELTERGKQALVISKIGKTSEATSNWREAP